MSFPHCDSNVLHRPGQCKYCDMYPEEQIARSFKGINFTGEQDPDKIQCPAEAARSLETINQWHGNGPMDDEQQAIEDAYWADFNRQLYGESGHVTPEWHTTPVDWTKFYALPAWRRPIYLFEALVLRRR